MLLVTGALITGAPARASGLISASASSSSASVGELDVSFSAAAAITSFTVHIITANGTDVLDLPEAKFTMTSPPGMASSTWALSNAITTSQLLLGTYSITVDATDGTDSVTGQPAGVLDYLIQPTVSLTVSPAVLNYASPTTTLSGTVTGLWPDGSVRPVTRQQVLVTNAEGQSLRTQTDANGDFSTSVSYADTFTASVSGSRLAPANWPSAGWPSVVVTTATTPTHLTATATSSQVTYGQQVTVSGQLTYQPETTSQGLGGMPVVIDAPGYPQLSIPVTAADGSFSATFTATASGSVLVYFNSPEYAEPGSFPYLASAEAVTNPITVLRPTSLTQFSASVTSSRLVSVTGCVGIADLPPSTANSVPGTVTIQYSAGEGGPWRRLGTITQLNSATGGSCGVATVEAAYTGSFPVKLASAYYRASFTPQANTNLLGSASTPVLAWKYPTQVKSLRVSARKLPKGSKLTISGQLLQDTKRWLPYGHQQVQIVYRKPQAKSWYSILTVTTNSAGRFTATFTDTFSATWSAFYPGNATHYNSSPAGIRVTVS